MSTNPQICGKGVFRSQAPKASYPPTEKSLIFGEIDFLVSSCKEKTGFSEFSQKLWRIAERAILHVFYRIRQLLDNGAAPFELLKLLTELLHIDHLAGQTGLLNGAGH